MRWGWTGEVLHRSVLIFLQESVLEAYSESQTSSNTAHMSGRRAQVHRWPLGTGCTGVWHTHMLIYTPQPPADKTPHINTHNTPVCKTVATHWWFPYTLHVTSKKIRTVFCVLEVLFNKKKWIVAHSQNSQIQIFEYYNGRGNYWQIIQI